MTSYCNLDQPEIDEVVETVNLIKGKNMDILTEDTVEDWVNNLLREPTEEEKAEMERKKQERRVKIYDFKRPDRFTREQIRTISMIHDVFSRLTTTVLSAKLRSYVHMHVAAVDQLTYEEFIRSVPTPTTMGLINADPLKGCFVIEIDPSITFAMIDRLAGGYGEGTKHQHELTDIEMNLMEDVVIRMLGNLRETWSSILDFRPRLYQIETNPQFAQITPPTEMVVLVTMECRINDIEGMINICYPYMTIEPIVKKLDYKFYYQLEGTAKKEPTDKKELNLDEVKIEVAIEFLRTELTIGEIKNWQIGNMIPCKLHQYIRSDDVLIGEWDKGYLEKDAIKQITVRNIKKRKNMSTKENVNYKVGGIDDIKVPVICELGRKELTIGDVKNFHEGQIIELNRLAGDVADIFVGNVLKAKAEICVVDECYAVRLVEIYDDN